MRMRRLYLEIATVASDLQPTNSAPTRVDTGLHNGVAVVALDADYAQTVNTGMGRGVGIVVIAHADSEVEAGGGNSATAGEALV
jgi:hypothetical protein